MENTSQGNEKQTQESFSAASLKKFRGQEDRPTNSSSETNPNQGITGEEYINLLKRIHNNSASQEDQERYRSLNREKRIVLGLEMTAPELMNGRLPKTQAEKFIFPDGYDYIIAINRNGVENYEDLDSYLEEQGGIHTNQARENAFSDRFYVPGHIEESGNGVAYKYSKNEILMTLINGYGTGFNFVIMIPFKAINESQISVVREKAAFDADGQTLARGLIEGSMLPSDYFTQKGDRVVINAKYLAGVVDNDGIYNPNESLLIK